MISLKIATQEDTPYIFEMCLKFIEESPYKDYPKDATKISSLISSFLSDISQRICLLATSKDIPIGIVAGQVSPALFSHQLVASEVLWWVEPEYRGRSRAAIELLGAFEDWGRRVGADYIQMVSLPFLGDSRAHSIYTRLGYDLKELAYVKEIH